MTRRRISTIQAAPVEGSPVGFDDVMPPADLVADIGRETWADTVAAQTPLSRSSAPIKSRYRYMMRSARLC